MVLLFQQTLGVRSEELGFSQNPYHPSPITHNLKSEATAADKQTTIVIPAVEFFDVAQEPVPSSQFLVPTKEKNRPDTSDASDLGFKELLGLQFEEILPEKNNGADFVLNSEYEFNTPLATSSQCRKQELIDFERKIHGSEISKQ